MCLPVLFHRFLNFILLLLFHAFFMVVVVHTSHNIVLLFVVPDQVLFPFHRNLQLPIFEVVIRQLLIIDDVVDIPDRTQLFVRGFDTHETAGIPRMKVDDVVVSIVFGDLFLCLSELVLSGS